MVKPSTSVRQLKKSNLHLPTSEQYQGQGWQAKSLESIQCPRENPDPEEDGYNSSSLSRLDTKGLLPWQLTTNGLVDRGAPLTRSEGALTMESSIHAAQRTKAAPLSSTNLSDFQGPTSSHNGAGTQQSHHQPSSSSCKTLSQMKHSSSTWSLSKTLAYCKQRLSKSAERLISTSSHSNHNTTSSKSPGFNARSCTNVDAKEDTDVVHHAAPAYHSSVYRLMKKITEKRKGQKCSTESHAHDVAKCSDTVMPKYDQRTTLSVLASLTTPPPPATLLQSTAPGIHPPLLPPFTNANSSGAGHKPPQLHTPSHLLNPNAPAHEVAPDDPEAQFKVQLWLASRESTALPNVVTPHAKPPSSLSHRSTTCKPPSSTSPSVILRCNSQQCYSYVPLPVNGDALPPPPPNFRSTNVRNSAGATLANIPPAALLSLSAMSTNHSFIGSSPTMETSVDDVSKLTRSSRSGLSDKQSPQGPYPSMHCSPTSTVPMGLTDDSPGIVSSSGNSSSLSSLNTSTGAFVPPSARLSRDSAICLSQAITSAQVSNQSDSSCMSLLTSCASPQTQGVGNPVDSSAWNVSAMTTSMIRNSGDESLLCGTAVPIVRGPMRNSMSYVPTQKQCNPMLNSIRPPPPPYSRHTGSPKIHPPVTMDVSQASQPDVTTVALMKTSLHSPNTGTTLSDQHVSQFRHSLLFPDRTDLVPKESPPASPAAPFVRGKYVAPPAHIGDYSHWRQHLPYKLTEHEEGNQLLRPNTSTPENRPQAPSQYPFRRGQDARNEHKRSSLMEYQMTEVDLLTQSQHQKLLLPKALSKRAHSKSSVNDFSAPSTSCHVPHLFPVASSSSSLSSTSPPSLLEERTRQIMAEAANLAGIDFTQHLPTEL